MTDIQTSLLLLIVRTSILNPVINFSTHLWPVKWNALGYTFALRIPFHLLQCRCNTCTNMINNDMIHFISSHDHIGSSILTSLVFHRCLRPSAPSLAQAHRHAVHRSKASDLPFTLATGPSSQVFSWSTLLIASTKHLKCSSNHHFHVSLPSTTLGLPSFATSPSHFHLHGICCPHIYTCGLITCVSHINTISPPRLSLNYQNYTRTFQSLPFW